MKFHKAQVIYFQTKGIKNFFHKSKKSELNYFFDKIKVNKKDKKKLIYLKKYLLIIFLNMKKCF